VTVNPVPRRPSSAAAPGKVILFGEHAVVYGRPAIAVPVAQVQATATVAAASAAGLEIRAIDLKRTFPLDQAPANDPLAAAIRVTLEHWQSPAPPAVLTISSTIPVASGMGSGTAVSIAIIRALSSYLGAVPDDELVSNLAYEVERLYHGTPSGIDNTVVTWNRPVYFSRDRSVQTLQIKTPFDLLIADTGVPSPTKMTVAEVRARWQNQPSHYEELFERIGQVTKAARVAIESGRVDELGPLMTRNQLLLEQLGVSSPELESLAQAGLAAGADGAKLSGGGRGGNLIVLARPEARAAVRQALLQAGAPTVISTVVT